MRLTTPFDGSDTPGVASTLAIFLFYAAIYLKDWGSQWASSTVAAVVLLAGMLLGLIALVFRTGKDSRTAKSDQIIILSLASCWMLTLLFKGTPNMSSYYIAIPCAFIITRTKPSLFINLLKVHLLLTITIAAMEYISGSYFFVYQADDGTELDETLFGGGLDVFRAKGMFQGPLSAVAFALWMAFLMRSSIPAAALLFLCAFFASGRLGMLTSSVLLGIRALKGKHTSTGTKIAWLTATACAAVALIAFSDENRITFISSALDVENDQNISRLYFWLTSLSHYLSYSPTDLLLGDYGYILKKEGGTENDFLRLLLDCGAIGFGIYAYAIFTLIRRAKKRRDTESLLIAFIIIILMNIFPFIQSLSSSTLFWVYFFSTNAPITTHKRVNATTYP